MKLGLGLGLGFGSSMGAAAAALLLLCVAVPGGAQPLAGGPGQHGPSISRLNVLLPPRTSAPARYTLEGSHGCFTWSSGNEDLVHVESEVDPAHPQCSTRAVISSIAPYEGRRSTFIYASDSVTGVELRCQVFIDTISRIQITHHSRKLDLDSLATLGIIAYDEEEDIFSTVKNLQFVWKLTAIAAEGESSPVHRLVPVPLEESSQSMKEEDMNLANMASADKEEYESIVYVVRGISAGHEEVTAMLVEPGLGPLSHSVTMTVAEAFSLDPPSPIYLISNSSLQFSLRTHRSHKTTVVQLPSINYEWFSQNTSVVGVDKYQGVVKALSLGSTYVKVKDTRLSDHEDAASIHVVTPVILKMSLSPLGLEYKHTDSSEQSAWHLTIGREYVVQVRAFALEAPNRPILITGSNVLRMLFDSSEGLWKAEPLSETVAATKGWRNSSLLSAKKEGSGTLEAILEYGSMVGVDDGKDWQLTDIKELTVQQTVHVCAPVRVHKARLSVAGNGDFEHGNVLRLPWIAGHAEEFELSASGGCGITSLDYTWLSLNPKIVLVTSQGVVRGRGVGSTRIRVASISDSLNYDEMVVEVSEPEALNMVQGLPVEAEISTKLLGAVVLQDSSEHKYDACSKIGDLIRWEVSRAEVTGQSHFEITSVSNSIPENWWADLGYEEKPETSTPQACAFATFRAAMPGRALILANLDVPNVEAGARRKVNNVLKVSWKVAAYFPLDIEQAADGTSHGGYGKGGKKSLKGRELPLTMGSSMRVRVKGGPERWVSGGDFLDAGKVKEVGEGEIEGEGGSESGVLVERRTEEGGRLYDITCLRRGSWEAEFSRGNVGGRGGPVFRTARGSLLVVCGLPHSLVLLIDNEDNSLASINASADLGRTTDRRHVSSVTLINGRTIRIAAVALQFNGLPVANSSSLALNWHLQKCENLAEWVGEPAGEGAGKKLLPGAWERYIRLKDAAGECTVRASVETDKLLPPREGLQFSEFDLNDGLQTLQSHSHTLSDAATLQLVKSLRIVPSEVLLLADERSEVTFQVAGGTSDIQASIENVSVAIISGRGSSGVEGEGEREGEGEGKAQLTVRANDIGATVLLVSDVGLASPSQTAAQVVVGEVRKLHLLLPEEVSFTPGEAALELGATAVVLLKAEDSMGRIFRDSEFSFLDIRVHLPEGVVRQEGGRAPLDPPNTVRLHAASLGLSKNVQVSVNSSRGRVYSNSATFSVFPPLAIRPSSLILSPGADYVVRIQGGPSNAVQQFVNLNDKIATVAGEGLVKILARDEGNTTISVLAVNREGRKFSSANLYIRVHVPDDVRLNVRGAKLGQGMETFAFPLGLLDGEDLLSFGQRCWNYSWSSENEQILSVQEIPHQLRSVGGLKPTSVDPFFSARIMGRSAGSTNLKLSFTCDFRSFSGKPTMKQYHSAETVTVVADPPVLCQSCGWLLPVDYLSSPILPQYGEGVEYKLIQEDKTFPTAALVEPGRIKTFSRPNVALLSVKKAERGQIDFARYVQVSEVAHMTVGGNGIFHHSGELSVGSSQGFAVTFKNRIGAPFFEGAREEGEFLVETNHFDVVKLKVELGTTPPIKASLLVEGSSQGAAIIRVRSRKFPEIVDYFVVHVGDYLHPQNPSLHVGGRVNFSISGRERVDGEWRSSDGSVLFVDPKSGEARAAGEGTALISFNGNGVHVSTRATVLSVTGVTVLFPPGVPKLSNGPKEQRTGYRFPVLFGTPRGVASNEAKEKANVIYNCLLEPPYLGSCTPYYDRATRIHYCEFRPASPEDLLLAVLGSKAEREEASKGELQMTVTAVTEGPSPISGRATVTFVGGFSLVDAPSTVLMSPSTNESRLTLVGNVGSLKCEWEQKNALDIKRVSFVGGLTGNAIYQVKVRRFTTSFTDTVNFTLPTTGQQVELRLAYHAKTGLPLWDILSFIMPYLSMRSLLILFVTILGICLIALLVKIYDRSPAAPPPITPATPSTPTTPANRMVGGPPGLGATSQSPVYRSGGNFAEYVERTANRSPYRGPYDYDSPSSAY